MNLYQINSNAFIEDTSIVKTATLKLRGKQDANRPPRGRVPLGGALMVMTLLKH